MSGIVIRFPDPERRSRDADAVEVRDPSESAIIIILPIIRVERFDLGFTPEAARRSNRARKALKKGTRK
jgi:hypothetical protein